MEKMEERRETTNQERTKRKEGRTRKGAQRLRGERDSGRVNGARGERGKRNGKERKHVTLVPFVFLGCSKSDHRAVPIGRSSTTLHIVLLYIVSLVVHGLFQP